MKKLIGWMLVFLAVAGVFCVSQAEGTEGASGTGNVRITAKDPFTGEAAGAVRLEIADEQTGEIVRTVRTDAKGGKTVSLAPGTYRVTVVKAPKGYATGTSTVLKVKKGRTTAWSVRILPQFTCKVKILDSEGKPVPGAVVRICGTEAVTNAKGVAVVKHTVYGKRQVTVVVTVDGGQKFLAYDHERTLKAGAGKTISRTIHLPDRSEWRKWFDYVVKKPVIYLYSREELNVNIRLGRPETVTASYPAYPENGWNVNVHPDGRMTDTDTGREIYCLYWEGLVRETAVRETGFAVAGKDTAMFLEEKLAYLGLTEREAEEFIIYWLPQMQGNAWNYIRFATEEEISGSMPLVILPAAERMIRIWMEYTPLDAEPEGIEPQELEPINREELDKLDFYAVEWGGTAFLTED